MKKESTIKKNELKKTMLNFKIFSLMKKQLFSLVILLAIMVIGSRAFGQGLGLDPDDPKMVAVGSISQFSITQTGDVADDINWEVLDLTVAECAAFGGSTAATAGTDYQFVTSLVDAGTHDPDDGTTAYVKWLQQNDATNYFVVQVTTTYSTTSTCSTVRRFYVSVFDFEVNVYLCDATGAVAGNPEGTIFTAVAAEAPITICNSWDDDVVDNALSGTGLAAMHADSINNTTANENKYTDTYFKVRIALTGNPGTLDLDQIKWRFRYSLQNLNGAVLDIYQVSQTPAGESTANFLDVSNTTITAASEAAEITIAAGTGWSGNNEVGVAAVGGAAANNEADYIYRMRTHNRAGQDANMTYSIRIDEVQLETTGASSSFNDGTKVNSAVAASYDNPVELLDGQSAIQSISQSPATSRIVVAD
jgi:hypothetical protein